MSKFRQIRAILKSLGNGATITAACRGAHLNRISLWRWRKDNPKLDKLIANALDSQIQVVEDALFKRACGFRYKEVTRERNSSRSIKKIITKELAPDPTAAIFYLTNRAPHRWADKRAVVNNMNVIKNVNNPLGKVPEEELDGIIAGFSKKSRINTQE